MQVRPPPRFESRGLYSQGLLNEIHGLEDLYRASGFDNVKITRKCTITIKGGRMSWRYSQWTKARKLWSKRSILWATKFSDDRLARMNTATGQPFSEFNVADDREIF